MIASHLLVQVVAHHAVLHLSHVGIVEHGCGIAADTGLETLRGGEVHVLRISHWCTVYQEIIGKCLVDVLVDLYRPDTVAVALHRQRLGQDLSSQQHLLGVRGLHAEDHTVVLVFGRDDGLGEETCHHTRCELLFLTRLGLRGLCVLHCLSRCLRVEEQWQGLTQKIFRIHPRVTELVVCVHLHIRDAVLVEKLRIVAGVAIEEVVCSHTQPEQAYLAVRVLRVIVDLRDIRRGKRAVAAQIRELVQMTQTIEKRLITTTRETADGTMVGIVDGAVMTLNIRHQVIVQIQTEHVAPEARSRCSEHARLRGGQQLVGVTVRQHHDHLLSLALSQQVVEDIVHTTNLIVYFLCVSRTADAVEHGVFLLRVLLVLRGQIDHRLVRGTQTLRVVVDIVELTVRHVLDVVSQRTFACWNLQQ